MSVTLTIDETLLREAEQATDIHDWPTLVKRGLLALIQKNSAPRQARSTVFDFDAALAAAAALPDLADEDFAQFEKDMNRPLPRPWSE